MAKHKHIKDDIVGKRFGSLVVLDEYQRRYVDDRGSTKISWKCKCDCGNEMFVDRGALFKRKVNYCPKCRPSGVRNDKLYHIYHGIKQRCYNPNSPSFEIYGGKGVKMCDEWLNSYDTFKEWALSNGYFYGEKGECTIDRIDSDGDYSPENCEWVPVGVNTARSNYGRQQAFTKLIDVYAISPDGTKEDITNIKKFARDHDLNSSSVYACLHGRLNPVYHGWTFHSNKTRPIKV